MSRPRRLGLVLLVLAAAVGLLTACDKPIPQVTAFANNTVTQLKAQNYCFDSVKCKLNINQKLPTLKALPGSTIQFDVPGEVADTKWSASAFVVGQDGSVQTIVGTAFLTNTHHTGLVVPIAAPGQTFFVGVQSTRGLSKGGEWQARVEIVS
jgi:hypothetical protein